MEMVCVPEDDFCAQFFSVQGAIPLTDPTVPTGINTGVSTVPLPVTSCPRRAAVTEHVDLRSNLRAFIVLWTHQNLR